MPTENSYLPFVPFLTSVLAAMFGISDISAYHKVCAAFYILGSLGVFALVRLFCGSTIAAFCAACLWSLFSPSAILFPEIAADLGGRLLPERLRTIVYYGEGPHNVSVAVIVWALYFYLKGRSQFISHCGFILLGLIAYTTNAFGAVSLALSVIALEVSLATKDAIGRSVIRALLTVSGIVVLALPWCTPLLYTTIARHSQHVGGDYGWTKPKLLAWMAIATVYAASAYLFTSLRPVHRFSLLLLLSIGVIPMAHYYFGVDIAPQPQRYHLELDVACAILIGSVVASIAPKGRALILYGALVLIGVQFPNYYRESRLLIRGVDITTTAQYQTATWANSQFGSQDRIFVGGDAGYLFNIFSDVLQVGNGHQPSTPNFMQAVGVFTIYSGMNAGHRDLDYSLLWLKAFGARAIIVPTRFEGKSIQPFSNPHKFEGKLNVIGESNAWKAYDTGYRQHSVFRFVNKEAFVATPPAHGLDISQLEPFVNEIEANHNGLMDIKMSSSDHWTIEAQLDTSMGISAAINYDDGWAATVAGRKIETRRDGLGLLALFPECSGRCRVDLTFDGGMPRRYAHWLGGVAWALVAIGIGRYGYLKLRLPKAGRMNQSPPIDS